MSEYNEASIHEKGIIKCSSNESEFSALNTSKHGSRKMIYWSLGMHNKHVDIEQTKQVEQRKLNLINQPNQIKKGTARIIYSPQQLLRCERMEYLRRQHKFQFYSKYFLKLEWENKVNSGRR